MVIDTAAILAILFGEAAGKATGEPLLLKGDDFAMTDVVPRL